METQKSNTALLVMDMQSIILRTLPDNSVLSKKVAGAIAHARKKNVPVFYVVVGFRQGLPEVGPNNKGFSASRERIGNANPEEWIKIDDSVAPLAGDLIITKRRVSAFTGSDLEVILRAQGIQHIILTGIATSGVVLSTLREAADKDYRITVLSDCCGDGDAEVHQVLTTKVFPRQADVVTIEDWSKM
jgi:nicotinamidase-related amidase